NGDRDRPVTGLPHRVRQASLVPGWRNSHPTEVDRASTVAAARPPEQTRAVATAVQQGSIQGRADAGEPVDPAPDSGRKGNL
ncbi:MAG: hypothetical protein WCA46_25965, partial [Actinocatenispora sp.]